MQALVSLALFHDYLFGDRFFAFTDIGSDTFAYHVPHLMHLADPANWLSAWSFNSGLGASVPLLLGPFTLLGIAGGPDHVLDMRIWVYIAKIMAGGAAFYGFVLAIGIRREIALIVALAYSFCGYVMTDGQWDTSSTEFVAYALILWALARYPLQPNAWLIPVSIALASYSGVFIFSVGIFIAYAFAGAIIASPKPIETSSTWLKSIVPQCIVGLLLSAPIVLPLVYNLLDSPRVTGAQSGFTSRLGEILSFNDTNTLLAELAGLFHKNILGVGDQHAGWMNYLESPVFFAGILPLLLIPQLALGSRTDRRILIAGGLAVGLFIALPAVRYLAFGFVLDYFRVNNLWVSILLLALFARALQSVFERGANRWLLGATALALTIGMLWLEAQMRPFLSWTHLVKILGFLVIALLASLSLGRALRWNQFAMLGLGLVVVESIVMNYPSFHAERKAVSRQPTALRYNDGTAAALAFLRTRDPGFYRIEKTFNSVALCDALAQGYMGVKSYAFHTSSVVRFYTGLGLIPESSPVKNFTNWLPAFGGRFVLNSLVGVKYLIAKSPVEWPGFHKIHSVDGLSVFENELALPLGVVYARQFPRDRFQALSLEAKDIVMTNAVIMDAVLGDIADVYDATELTRVSNDWLREHYVVPAQTLKRRGMKIEHFSDGGIRGRISSDARGVLVFSIPYARGWTVAIDGVDQQVFRANLGMLATTVSSGTHQIALRYSLPGLIPGLLLALLGLAGMGTLVALAARKHSSQ